MRLLVVEDDADVAEQLVLGLRRYGHDVVHVESGTEALQRAGSADMVLLDLGLPDLDGFEVCRQLRETSSVPVIALTARSGELDRVLGLRLGADDYLVKPYGFPELLARIDAVARRTGVPVARPSGPPTVRRTVGSLTVDLRTREVFVGGEPVRLTRKQFDLLAALSADPGALFTRDALLEQVWQDTWGGASRTLDVHVAALRRALGSPDWIETVRGVGFRLARADP